MANNLKGSRSIFGKCVSVERSGPAQLKHLIGQLADCKLSCLAAKSFFCHKGQANTYKIPQLLNTFELFRKIENKVY